MGSTVKKIALLSGGGDCPGLNAVIRTITKTAISKYGYEVIGFVYGYRGLYHNNYVELTEEQLKQFRRVSERRKSENRKETVTLRLSAKSLRKAKSLGKGYTAVLSRILEDALNDNEVIFKHM